MIAPQARPGGYVWAGVPGAGLAESGPPRRIFNFGWGVRKWISDLGLGPSTRLRLAQADAGRQFQIGSRRGSDFEIFDLRFTIWGFLRLPRRCAPRNDYMKACLLVR